MTMAGVPRTTAVRRLRDTEPSTLVPHPIVTGALIHTTALPSVCKLSTMGTDQRDDHAELVGLWCHVCDCLRDGDDDTADGDTCHGCGHCTTARVITDITGTILRGL